jgi:hypothetical protein
VTEDRPTLDFIVIGAAKAGTTSLFEYLRTHPEINLPKWKETNFFLDPLYQRGVDWYLDWVLAGAPAGAVCGEASVRCMAGTPLTVPAEGSAPAAPEENAEDLARVIPSRIHTAVPEAKLIALLRDPVKRCVSEHGMAALRGEEQRDLDQALTEMLAPVALDHARTRFSSTNCYIVQGEYGRILTPFFELFSKRQILVLFSSELADEPATVVQRVCGFLGVDDTFVPPNLDVRYLKGATKPRFRSLDLPRLSKRLQRSQGFRKVWKRVPAALRRRAATLSYVLEKWNRAKASAGRGPSLGPAVERELRSHFHADGERLAKLTGLEPPWL